MEIYIKESEMPMHCKDCFYRNVCNVGTDIFDEEDCRIKSLENHDTEVRTQAIKEYNAKARKHIMLHARILLKTDSDNECDLLSDEVLEVLDELVEEMTK